MAQLADPSIGHKLMQTNAMDPVKTNVAGSVKFVQVDRVVSEEFMQTGAMGSAKTMQTSAMDLVKFGQISVMDSVKI